MRSAYNRLLYHLKQIPSGYDLTVLPWKITMLLIGKPSISMGHFPWLCYIIEQICFPKDPKMECSFSKRASKSAASEAWKTLVCTGCYKSVLYYKSLVLIGYCNKP